jgi:peptidoglycan/LPS O-acetylase OafA/YrhL
MLNYRSDVDGLRAVAVLSITIFHLNSSLLSGGFIGVDVFFVISGYLITSIIYKDLQNNNFSFLGFYARRVRRLFPALFVMLFAASATSYKFLLPTEFVNFSISLAASTFYVSNILFYNTIDYFNGADFAPLIHTWSLSIEEQFYLVMPLGMFLAFKYASRRILLLTLILGAVSLITSEIWVQSGSENAAFYLMPARIWQFSVGSIVALAPKPRLRVLINNTLAATGAIGILGSAWFFSEKMPFPGAWALLPTLCTALVIFCGQKDLTWTAKILSLPPMRFFGAISYSLYLYHWPIIVFYRLMVSPYPSLASQILLFLISCGAGLASYLFVERPSLRVEIDQRFRQVITAGLTGSAGFALLAFLVVTWNGLPSRLPEHVVEIGSYLDYPKLSSQLGSCFLHSGNKSANEFDPEKCITTGKDRPNVLLMGDSHAAHYYLALKQLFPDVNLSQINASGCRPVLSPPKNHYCFILMNTAIEKYIPENNFDYVILSGLWNRKDVPALNRTVDMIAPYVKHVYVFGPTNHYWVPLPRLIASSYLSGRKGAIEEDLTALADVSYVDTAMRRRLNSRAHYLSPLPVLCPNGTCITQLNGSPVQYDKSHLTVDGALFVLKGMVASGHLTFEKPKQTSNAAPER